MYLVGARVLAITLEICQGWSICVDVSMGEPSVGGTNTERVTL